MPVAIIHLDCVRCLIQASAFVIATVGWTVFLRVEFTQFHGRDYRKAEGLSADPLTPMEHLEDFRLCCEGFSGSLLSAAFLRSTSEGSQIPEQHHLWAE
jgi:hypothetical protein